MSTTARMEQVADMVAYYRTGRGAAEIALRCGADVRTVWQQIVTYGGCVTRASGHRGVPRLNEYATPETWRCVDCRRGLADGAIRASGRYEPYCRACRAARALASYHRRRERIAS